MIVPSLSSSALLRLRSRSRRQRQPFQICRHRHAMPLSAMPTTSGSKAVSSLRQIVAGPHLLYFAQCAKTKPDCSVRFVCICEVRMGIRCPRLTTAASPTLSPGDSKPSGQAPLAIRTQFPENEGKTSRIPQEFTLLAS